ncbi:MAG: type I glyceraldehyde-3-phosphate dehydrogenase [Saprospiraceae bacterium]
MKRIAINGFGRIGRLTFRNLVKMKDVEVVAINDLTDTKTLAHLLKYDSAHGKFDGTIEVEEHALIINGKKVLTFAEKLPLLLPWKSLEIDVVIDCTGRFTDSEDAKLHLKSGAKKVVISAPATGEVETIVIGVNDDKITADKHIFSNASCTTNCLAPMAKVLDEAFGIESGFMQTIHAYTADQNLQDAPHRDLRRARAAAYSMVPTSTGAAKAVALVLPQLKGKLNGSSIRVPIINGSITDFTAVLKKPATVDEINAAFKAAADGSLKGILYYETDPIVSIDIVGNQHSCIFDSKLTLTLGNTVKVLGWYDNEAGYSARLADLAILI